MFSLLLLSPAFLETQRSQPSNVSFSSCPRVQNLIHNKFFVPLLRQSGVKCSVQSPPVSVSVLRDFYCHSKFLWSSLRKSVSVLSFKASVFCFHVWFISISLLPFNFFEQSIWSYSTVQFSVDERTSHHWSCVFGSPASPFTPKQCDCCPLAHEQSTPQESWVFRVSIYWLHKSI